MFKTNAILSKRNRYLLHQAIENVWGSRLAHQTGRKNNCMYIWVPGSKIPRWLHEQHQKTQRHLAMRNTVENASSAHAPAVEVPVREPRPVNPVWNAFAQDENVRYDTVAAMSGAEYAAAEAQKAEAECKDPQEENKPCTFIETFKQTGMETANGKLGGSHTEINGNSPTNELLDATNEVEEIAKLAPRKAALPPHLRAKRAAIEKEVREETETEAKAAHGEFEDNASDQQVDASDSEGDEDKGVRLLRTVWVAAKLPFPCSSD